MNRLVFLLEEDGRKICHEIPLPGIMTWPEQLTEFVYFLRAQGFILNQKEDDPVEQLAKSGGRGF